MLGIPRNCSFSSIRRSTTRLRVGLYYSSSSKKSPIQYEVKWVFLKKKYYSSKTQRFKPLNTFHFRTIQFDCFD